MLVSMACAVRLDEHKFLAKFDLVFRSIRYCACLRIRWSSVVPRYFVDSVEEECDGSWEVRLKGLD